MSYLWSGFSVGSEKKKKKSCLIFACCMPAWLVYSCGFPNSKTMRHCLQLHFSAFWRISAAHPPCSDSTSVPWTPAAEIAPCHWVSTCIHPRGVKWDHINAGELAVFQGSLWVILAHALVKSVFSMAFPWGEGPGTGQSLENRNRKPSVGVKCPLPLSRGDPFRGHPTYTFPSSLIFTQLLFLAPVNQMGYPLTHCAVEAAGLSVPLQLL